MENKGNHPRRIFIPVSIVSLLFLILSCMTVFAASGEIPLTRAILFKNGIGFFEHEGTVTGPQTVRIPITATHLDDVLKSLTVLDMNGGQIGSISYGSSAPLEKQLEELGTGDLRGMKLASILGKLTGTSLEADAPGGKVSGRLLNAEVRKESGQDGAVSEVIELALYTEQGDLRTVILQSLTGLRFASDSTRQDLSRYLDVVDSARNDTERILEIKTLGSGERTVKLSYTVEAPIWKASYRLIMDESRPAFLQGWAIVDNTTSSDWNNVDLSLVSSSPVSFIQRLSQPVYARRPEVPVSVGPQVAPELHGSSMDDEGFAGGAALAEMGLARKQKAVRMESSLAMAAPMAAPGAPLADSIQDSNIVSAQAFKVGNQFEYRLAEPVTIRRNQSALIPILQSEIEAEKVALYTSGRGESSPRSAVWVKNSTEFALDGGPFSINDSGLFAGEGLFDTVYQGERRLLSYALDQAVSIEEDVDSSRRVLHGLSGERGVLVVSHKLEETRVYRIKNNDDSNRDLLIEHPLRNGWILKSPSSFEEKSSDFYRFKVKAAGQASIRFAVSEERILSRRVSLDAITENEVKLWITGADPGDAIGTKLAPLMSVVRDIDAFRKRISSLESEKDGIYRSQDRVRQNLSSLGASPSEAGLRQRYVSQLEEQENRLDALEGNLKQEHEGLEQLRRKLSGMIASIDL